MATTIKSTPAVKGKESKRFNEVINASKTNKIAEAEKNRMFDLVAKVLANKNIK